NLRKAFAPETKLLAEIVEEALEEKSQEGVRIADIELEVRESLREIGQIALRYFLENADTETEAEIECVCGGKLQFRRQRAATIWSVFGKMSYEGGYYAGCDCGKGYAVVDQRYGIEPGKVTAGLARAIPDHERIVTIEDSVELQMMQTHKVSLEARPPDYNGDGQVTIRDLVKNSLRMRPDRIIVGEIRGGETLDMLQAMNTGHDGSMTTVHSNSPRDTLSRLETMTLMAGFELPVLAIRKQIAAALDLIVYLTRFPDGTRKVTQISEVAGMESEVITLTDIFKFEQTGIDKEGKPIGQFRPTGLRPMFSPKLEAMGYRLDRQMFSMR
ncbi:MAG: ATPase, T2SS/T4P/T4SS family, partial [Chloroflexota bacterium]